MKRIASITVGLLLVAAPAVPVDAAPDADEGEPGDQRAILTLVVNEVPRGEITVTLRGNDVLVTAGALAEAGLTLTGGSRGAADLDAVISLRSLAPDLQFMVDVDELTLTITAAPRLLGEVVIDLRTRPPQDVVEPKSSSAWLNYAVTSGTGESLTVTGEAGASLGGSLFLTNVTRYATGDIVRSASSWTIDWPELLVRSVIGDTYADAGGLGGGAFIGGISIARAYELDPYAVRHPTFGLSGATASPGELDVYVNGALVRREAIAPGTFQIRNLPLVTGAQDTRLVIKDNFGREHVIDSAYYFSAGLLAKGLSDFAFDLGARRLDIGNASWSYGSPVMVGRYRRGLTDSLTAGAHAEAAWDLVSGGASVATVLGVGELEVEGAASCAGQNKGAAAAARYVFASARGNLGFGGQFLGSRFATLARDAAADRPTAQVQAFAGTHVGRVGLSLQVTQEHGRDADTWTQRAQLAVTTPIGSKLSASLTASGIESHTTGGSAEIYAILSAPLGSRTTATMAASHAHGDDQTTFGLQRSLPLGTGLGYQLQATAGTDTASLDGAAQLQGRYGRYELRGAATESGGSWSATAAGAIVAIGGNVFATRPVQDGFALVRVPGVAGVHATLDNVDVGTTDVHGDLLIPSLLPYYGNRIAIRDSDVPIDRTLDATELDVTVPYRGGAVVLFRADRLHGAMGSLVVVEPGGERATARFGTLTVELLGGPVNSPIGYDGEFFLEQIVAGHYPATIEYTGGLCRFQLTIPRGDEPISMLGTLTCNVPSKGAP